MAIWRGPSGILLPQKNHPAAHCRISHWADERSQTWKLTSYPEKYCNFFRHLLIRQFLRKWQRGLYAADCFSQNFKFVFLIVQDAVRQLQWRRWFVYCFIWVRTILTRMMKGNCFEHNLTMGLILHEVFRQFIIHPFNHGIKLICPDNNSRTIAVSWHN